MIFQQIQNGDLDGIRETIKNGANINEKYNQATPLHFACYNNSSFEIIELIVSAKPEIDSLSLNNFTPLHTACKFGCSSKVLKLLLSNGANPNARDIEYNCPIHFLCESEPDLEKIKTIVEAGANVELKNGDKRNCLHLCSICSSPKEIFEYLLMNGVDPSMVDSFNLTPLHYSVLHGTTNETIQLLLAYGSDPNVYDQVGTSPLLHVCKGIKGGVEIAKTLLFCGADQFLENNKRENARKIAQSSNQTEICTLLDQFKDFPNSLLQLFVEEKGCDLEINVSNDQKIPVHSQIIKLRCGMAFKRTGNENEKEKEKETEKEKESENEKENEKEIDAFMEKFSKELCLNYEKDEIFKVLKCLYYPDIELSKQYTDIAQNIGLKDFVNRSEKKLFFKDLSQIFRLQNRKFLNLL
ncbi:ada2a-containing complex component 3 isoform d [Anaeramoeba flamelloides]|uniref:Ada2a-containing complex component 3 isoform d n=1 Tax=Anaeramoeba flamelloides TaxID=1746091 RepID=A0AAV7Z0L3_9EUKA|nr:ada2a-containing complex component 3 isoform d [Anaeramoeba flamelloides]